MNNVLLSKCGCFFGSNSMSLQARLISTTSIRNLIQAWRKQKGLPLNPNASGPLTDKPDFTYLDGRPTPLGMRQKRRMLKQKEIALKIITLSKEVDFAVDRHAALQKAEQDAKNRILSNKLMPKGHLLMKTDN